MTLWETDMWETNARAESIGHVYVWREPEFERGGEDV